MPQVRLFSIHKAGIYALYVLFLLLLAYLLNQLDRYCLAICTQPMAQEIEYGDQSCLALKNVSKDIRGDVDCPKIKNDPDSCDEQTGTDNKTIVCDYNYNGNGFQYQLLVGPIFIVIYTFSGIPLGYAADLTNRKNLLAFCLIMWSAMTLLTGFATEYWHLAVLRFGLGIFEAGCTPFASSIIADYFSEDIRGSALGVYNMGIYIGYSLSYAFGNFITDANINGQGWRWTFFISGIPGFALGALILFTMREPERTLNRGEQAQKSKYEATALQRLTLAAKQFLSPSLLLICIAGSIRNGAGYVWGFNTQNYFNLYYPNENTGLWFSWIPLVGGSIGVVFGGVISDNVVRTRGPVARIWVLIFSLLLAAPFAAGTLFLPPPWAFVSQIPCYLFGEMWVGVTLAVVVELVPSAVRATAVAFYLFIITNIGGNMNLLVSPIEKASSLKTALYLLYPGCYVLGAAVFLLSLFVIKRDIKKVKNRELTDESRQGLLASDNQEGEEDAINYGSTKREGEIS
ncbi:MFS-type efflux pump MSMEG_3705-like [Amphiura filiformis]|uniref:MFS-type efflux pump MSMEG_3705-like n=1 Tax=Amphiura filiformis TaxID=82378 RepID=UPI003B21C7C8